MVTTQFKRRIIEALVKAEKTSGLNGRQFSTRIGINPAQWSRLKAGETDGIITDGKYITLGREHGLTVGESEPWKTVETATFQYITSLLSTCHQECISSLLVDVSDLGKSYAAKHYCRNNQNALYIDCSQVKSRQLLIREIARQAGVTHTDKYNTVYRDLVYYLRSISKVIIILDEVGDLDYPAFLELKALWNATEGAVSWIMMGADGLRRKIERAINGQKVGYTEIFRRFGSQYRRITPASTNDTSDFKLQQIGLVAKANAPAGTDIQKLVHSSRGSLTNLNNMIRVLNSTSTTNVA